MRNRLLATLSQSDFALLQPDLERRSLEQGEVIERPGISIDQVFFPEPGMVSVVAHTLTGMTLEAGVIGPEGVTGLPLLHGVDQSPNEVRVQIPCRALCLPAEALVRALRSSRPLHDHLLRFAHAFQVQLAQTVVCNGRLTINERLARWLLMCHDRADREDLPLTHEFLSLMLGVRRPGITTALQVLEGAGALKMRRGVIAIRDRTVLTEAAGDGYGTAEAEYERLFGRS
ncbi:Crp/Fnr family transcriptional regulator [Methylobacterium sp.]|uniref:Crp/Fnr family transcriptional regulator n=1 Tax=Methylobacterium sp. TaxID=409 RepID=UPI0025CEA6E9|nr:Crp/Fnr family transcriptional regulator [Methylobacterium sp.]